ncbi:hypothetical protein F2Q69_00003759 [Brassica cretica]|uniref:non-specific serine/threonine protein kinase n=1 Tax=Brassica cretica TaxID=69181 RepID=A0A8S9P1L5_BRACR|nr:hypothetical protein F2Q69_00003759 [Brassica cretica]
MAEGQSPENSPPSPTPPSPSSPDNTQQQSPPSSGSGDAPNTGAIIGIAAGAGLLLLVMILFCVCCCRKKKKKNQMPYYASNGYATGKDFGLAKLSQDNVTHVSTRIMGTFGYLAPEYASSGKLTDRSDVFSFGVMLLELITGRRPVDLTGEMEDSLVDWARPLCLNAAQDGDYSELVDPRLEGQYEPYEMARMVACAAAAIRHSARRRPKMSQIVRALEGDASLEDLNEVKPGQSLGRGSSSDYDSSTYSADMRKFRKVAMDSHEYGATSEYGNTSEYGLDPSSSSSEEIHTGGGSGGANKNNKTIPSREL